MQTRLAGLVVLGSNGEAPLLDDAESDAVIETVRANVPRDRTLIGGVGRESTAATIAAATRAARIGVDIVLVRTPSFYKNVMTSDAFVRYYTAVADASPVPVLLYNVSMFTGVNLLPDAVERLAAHPNIIGMKESNADLVQLAETIARTPDEFVVLGGSAPTFYHALCAGADGGVLAISERRAGYLRRHVRSGSRAAARGSARTATAHHPARTAARRDDGVAGLKYALDQIGYVGGPTRPPLGTVPPDAQRQIREQLAALGTLAARDRAFLNKRSGGQEKSF